MKGGGKRGMGHGAWRREKGEGRTEKGAWCNLELYFRHFLISSFFSMQSNQHHQPL